MTRDSKDNRQKVFIYQADERRFKYYEDRRIEAELRGDDPLLGMFNSDRDERSTDLSRIYHKMEEEQDEEDTNMLIRLVKIRHSLWT